MGVKLKQTDMQATFHHLDSSAAHSTSFAPPQLPDISAWLNSSTPVIGGRVVQEGRARKGPPSVTGGRGGEAGRDGQGGIAYMSMNA